MVENVLNHGLEEEESLSLLDFLEGYPDAVKEQFMQGARTLPQNRQAGALQMLYSPVAPSVDYFYDRVAHLLGPNLNKMWRAQHESHNRALENLGVEPQDEYQDVTREQLAAPLAIAGSLIRGSPQWYSALKRAIKDAKQKKGDYDYWMAEVRKTPGATAEAKMTGVDKSLAEYGLPPEVTEASIGFKKFKGSMTKEEVLGLLEPREIELERTVRGGDGYTVKHLTQEELLPFGMSGSTIWGVIDPEGNLAMRMPHDNFSGRSGLAYGGTGDDEAWNLAGRPEWYYGENDAKQAARWHNSQHRPDFSPPQYADRQDLRTAGGTDYREILIHLPRRESSDYWYDLQNEYVQGMHKKYGDGWVNKATSQELEKSHALGEKAEFADGPGRNYTGGHWAQDNTLGHIRVSNITANNLKSLHSDEYQLDWYQTAERARRGEIRRLSQALNISKKEAAKRVPKDFGYITTIEQSDPDGNLIPRTGVVPDEPFKEKGWELLFKDHFMEAINDPSIEAITWTTGDTQANRYSLSRVFGKIDVRYSSAESDPYYGKYSITAYPKDGSSAPQVYTDIHGDDLGNYIGGELATKAIREIKDAPSRTELIDIPSLQTDFENTGGSVTYEGLDLNMGGKFLQFIYDKKTPQFFKDLLKGFKMPPKKVFISGHEDAAWTLHSDAGILPLKFKSREAAQSYLEKHDGQTGAFSGFAGLPMEDWEISETTALDVWQQRITDEMREKFKGGMSLTQREDTGLLGSYA